MYAERRGVGKSEQCSKAISERKCQIGPVLAWFAPPPMRQRHAPPRASLIWSY